MDDNNADHRWQQTAAYRSTRRAMRDVHRDELIAMLGGLAMDPANAMQQLRLEALAHVAASLPTPVGRRPTVHDLRRIAARGGSDLLRGTPDPPEQPFAVPILFGRERGVVPLGLIVGVDYDARRLFEVIEDLRTASPDIERLAQLAECVLRLIGHASQRAGLAEVVAPGTERDRARVPSQRRLASISSAVVLDPADLQTDGKDWSDLLAPLTSEVSASDITFDGENGSLSHRPFVSTRGGLVLAVPGMVLPALLRHLKRELVRVASAEASSRYASRLWQDIENSLRLMRIRPEGQGEGEQASLSVGHRLFRVDEVQLLAVTLVAPDPFSSGESLGEPEAAIAASHRELLALGDGHVALVLLHAPDGGPSFFGLEAPPAGVVELLLTPEELAVIARTEPGEPRALSEFAEASTRIRDSVHVFGFGLLDEYAIYRQHQSSYYLSDEARPTAMLVVSGSALELRVDAARRDLIQLVEIPADGEPVRVMPRYESSRGIYGPVDPAGQPARIAMTQPSPVWVVGAPYSRMAPGEAETWHVVLDTVAYWIWELRLELEPMLRALPVSGKPAVIVIRGLDQWRDEGDAQDGGPIAFRIEHDENAIVVRLGSEFERLVRVPNNGAERFLVASLLEAFEALTGLQSATPALETVDRVAPFGVKKMLLLIDAVRNADIGPDDVPAGRSIRDAVTATVLDRLGSALEAEGREPAPAGDSSERLALLHLAVDVLYTTLQAEVAGFSAELLEYLFMRNEAELRARAQHGFHLPARVACFPEDQPDLMAETASLARASIASRFLIEYVAARPPAGTRSPSLGAVDHLLAISDTMTSLGHAADLEHLGLADTNARLLPSGRLGVNDSVMRDAIRAYTPSFAERHVEEATGAFELRWHESEEPGEPSDRQLRFDHAARQEWGFTVTEMADIIVEAINLSVAAGQPVMVLPATDLIARIADGTTHGPELVRRVLDQLTLKERDNFLGPPEPFKASDVYPWRFNRHLSLLRKPFVHRVAAGVDQVVFGRRALYESGHYLMELISTSRLRPNSREMAVLMGQLSTERGSEFNERVAVQLEAVLGRPVRRGVKKVDRRRIAADGQDLGDVDVLGAQPSTRTIWAIECKALAGSRTPYEIASELHDLLGAEHKIGLVGKHERRVAWLEDNLGAVVAELGLEADDWVLKGAFVVDTDLLSPYLRATPVPVWTVSKLLTEVGQPAKVRPGPVSRILC